MTLDTCIFLRIILSGATVWKFFSRFEWNIKYET